MDLLNLAMKVPVFRALWRRFPAGGVEARTKFGIWGRPAYAYGVYSAATLARSLGLSGVTVAEFGVAGGAGLLALEAIAADMEQHFRMEIAVAGFDTGTGMPPPVDYRDMAHVWAQGFYRMDEQKLRASLSRAELVIGDVAATTRDFVQRTKHPIGFISFDLDYYSSTKNAFGIFSGPMDSRLPRVFCYFDDIIWPEQAYYNEFVGEYLAIAEFNAEHELQKISKIPHLAWIRPMPAAWNEQMYVMHDFAHPDYSRNITPQGDRYRQKPL
jgi:hypothetical protein